MKEAFRVDSRVGDRQREREREKRGKEREEQSRARRCTKAEGRYRVKLR